MTLILLVIVVLLALLLLLVRRRGAAGSLLTLALLLALAIGCGPVPGWLLAHLQGSYAGPVTSSNLPQAWQNRNVILLLGAGTVKVPDQAVPEPPLFAYGRIAQALALYRQCKAAGHDCMLLVSGGNPQRHAAAEAQVYGAELLRLGMPGDDLQLETHSNTTWQNAQFSRPMLVAYHPDRIWLVTSGVHMRRSLQYFGHFGIHPVPVRGDYVQADYSWLPLSWNMAVNDLALHEYLGIARYYVYQAMGWNAPVQPDVTISPAPVAAQG